jgi:hypothetical protein
MDNLYYSDFFNKRFYSWLSEAQSGGLTSYINSKAVEELAGDIKASAGFETVSSFVKKYAEQAETSKDAGLSNISVSLFGSLCGLEGADTGALEKITDAAVSAFQSGSERMPFTGGTAREVVKVLLVLGLGSLILNMEAMQ